LIVCNRFIASGGVGGGDLMEGTWLKSGKIVGGRTKPRSVGGKLK
jgi:hypothetical protein